jgi:acyl-CoA oxidase
LLEAFARTVDSCDDEALKTGLNSVCDLFALATIEADRAWFQEHGRISSTRAKAVTRGVNTLCTELRPHARTLVDAFGIPDELLRAPIGLA